MKCTASTLIIAAAMSMLATSCKVYNLPNVVTPSDAYVQLKNGKKFTGSKGERRNGMFVKDRIKLDDTTFKSKHVAFYCTGYETFANVERKFFAPQVAAGKINMFRAVYTEVNSSKYGNSREHKRVSYFIQDKPGNPINRLSYNSLLPMVKPSTPEFDMLERYRKTRVVSRSLGYGGLGLIVSGIALATAANSNAGVGMFLVGTAAIFPSIIIKGRNSNRLIKTVLIADDMPLDGTKNHQGKMAE